MSLHKSKGLNSPYVFVAGCVEGLVPGGPEPGTPATVAAAMLEEDRRLFYVAITRVKADPEHGRPGYLALTYPQRMPAAAAYRSQIVPAGQQGGIALLQPSRFLAELGPQAPAPTVGPL
jgi:DNA helicase II / ATP-dependent DNA helicase PcrA